MTCPRPHKAELSTQTQTGPGSCHRAGDGERVGGLWGWGLSFCGERRTPAPLPPIHRRHLKATMLRVVPSPPLVLGPPPCGSWAVPCQPSVTCVHMGFRYACVCVCARVCVQTRIVSSACTAWVVS